jgi:hypothetical protein
LSLQVLAKAKKATAYPSGALTCVICDYNVFFLGWGANPGYFLDNFSLFSLTLPLIFCGNFGASLITLFWVNYTLVL